MKILTIKIRNLASLKCQDDQVFDPAFEEKVALSIQSPEIARVEPAVPKAL